MDPVQCMALTMIGAEPDEEIPADEAAMLKPTDEELASLTFAERAALED